MWQNWRMRMNWDKRLTKTASLHKRYKGDTARIQNHFPDVSRRTIQRWVKKAREQGYL
jgi:transposase